MAVNDILAILDERATAMSIGECAELLTLDKTTLYRQAREGRFPVFSICGVIRVNPAELASYIRAGSNISTQPVDRRRRKVD